MSTGHITIQPAAKAALIVLAMGAFCGLWAAGAAIGMVTANGNLQVDHARVAGNGTVFDGSVIQTEAAASRIQLNNGVQLRLSADTRATVYERRLLLEQGQSEMAPTAGYEVEARSLRITAATPGAFARIKLDPYRRVLVASVRGTLRVANSAGVVVAQIEAGDALNLEPQAAGATAATQASGCLLEKNGRFILVDRTTNVVLEVQGPDLSKNAGNRVRVTGRAESVKPQVPDASQVVSVAGIQLVAKGGCGAVAKKVGAPATAAAAAGAAPAAGVGAGTVAVIGGVAAAATVGGLAAVGDLPGQGSTAPSASR